MADDTRQSTPSTPEANHTEQTNNSQQDPSPPKPKYGSTQSQAGKLWDAFGNPEDQANMLPGTVSNNKSNDSKDVTVTDAMKSISTKDLTSFYKAPCARDSLMLGIGAAFGVGGIRGVLGGLRSVWTACNWAVGAFAVTSLASHEFCQRRRIGELDGMKQAMELMQQLKVKKQREKEQKLEEGARLAEEERKRKSWVNPSNYKFW